MIRRADFLLMLAAWALAGAAWAAEGEITKPEEARADPDFAIQGEYLGEGVLPDGEQIKAGAQVIALGGGEFALVFYEGGLPGAGWKRGEGKLEAHGRREGEATAVASEDVQGKIADAKITITNSEGNGHVELKRVERKSPTLGQKPPEGAVVLFDGSGTDYFPGATMTDEGNLVSGTLSKAEFADAEIHLEFRLTWMPNARGQGRSNSGVYVHNCYEIQVLDSFGLDGHDNECGGVYSIKAPDVNMCLPPLVWQTYDIDFTAPKFDASGNKVANGRLTLKHNGVVVHDDLELPRACPGGQGEGPGPRGIQLQGHGCHVQYRNIWVQKKE